MGYNVLHLTCVQISVDSPVVVTDRRNTGLVIPPPLASVKARFVPLSVFASAPFALRMAVSLHATAVCACMQACGQYTHMWFVAGEDQSAKCMNICAILHTSPCYGIIHLLLLLKVVN